MRSAPGVRRPPGALLATILLATMLFACALMAGAEDRSYLSRAYELASRGEHAQALAVLREARSVYAGTDILPEVLLQSARSSRALGEEFRARYFLAEILRLAPESAAAAEAGKDLGDALFGERLYDEALDAYRVAAAAAERGVLGGRQEILLRMAEITALYLGDRAAAREYLGQLDASRLDPGDRDLFALIASRASWEQIPTSTLGLEDPNISALALDGDDLWIGTWSGGLARLSLSAGTSTVFRAGENSLVANTVRSICVTDHYVWVGTDQGLSQYSKALSKWRPVPELSGEKPKKIQAVRQIGLEIWVATLGDGIWVLEGESWREAGLGSLPTPYITCLEETERGVLAGTMDHGLILLSRKDGRLVGSETPSPAIRSRNITALHRARGSATVWVATYGEGLWEWDGESGAVRQHLARDREIGDDWVMCLAESDRAIYAGTFGGGVSSVDASGHWRRYGLADGLAGLDVLVALAAGERMIFGTLGMGLSIYHEGLSPW